jgi:hypothetical protein
MLSDGVRTPSLELVELTELAEDSNLLLVDKGVSGPSSEGLVGVPPGIKPSASVEGLGVRKTLLRAKVMARLSELLPEADITF